MLDAQQNSYQPTEAGVPVASMGLSTVTAGYKFCQSSPEREAVESSSFLRAKGLGGESKAYYDIAMTSSAYDDYCYTALTCLHNALCNAHVTYTTAHTHVSEHCMSTLHVVVPHSCHARYLFGHFVSAVKNVVLK